MSGPLRDLVPEVLRPLLPNVFDRPQLDEVNSTCMDCAMCKKGGEPEPDDEAPYFRPDSKCCTFHPTLPNFYVGALLSQSDPEGDEGRKRVRAKIAGRFGVSPFWLAPPRKTRVFLEASRHACFGRSRALVCPYFMDDGRCSVWKYREAVCSTYYCKHSQGAAGRRFWTLARDWFTYMEGKLSFWAARQVDADVQDDPVPALRMTLDDLEDRPPSDDEHRALWGKWYGREEEFYRACYAQVKTLDPKSFMRVVEDEKANDLLLRLIDQHDAVTAPRLAERLMPARDLWRRRIPGGETVVSYSNFDPQFLSDGLLHVFMQMRPDEPVDAFIARMRDDHGVDVPRAMLLRLQLFEILVPPKQPAAEAAPSKSSTAAAAPPKP